MKRNNNKNNRTEVHTFVLVKATKKLFVAVVFVYYLLYWISEEEENIFHTTAVYLILFIHNIYHVVRTYMWYV